MLHGLCSGSRNQQHAPTQSVWSPRGPETPRCSPGGFRRVARRTRPWPVWPRPFSRRTVNRVPFFGITSLFWRRLSSGPHHPSHDRTTRTSPPIYRICGLLGEATWNTFGRGVTPPTSLTAIAPGYLPTLLVQTSAPQPLHNPSSNPMFSACDRR